MTIDDLKMSNFLRTVQKYIEYAEVRIEDEFGWCRPLKELIDDGHMPEVYDDVITMISEVDEHMAQKPSSPP